MAQAALGFVRLVLCALCLSVPFAAWAEGDDEAWIGKPAPAFQVKDLDGKDLRLSDFAGKKLVWINFWGLRCGPCIQEMPVLEKVYKTYEARGVVMIGLNSDGVDGNHIRKAVAERPELKSMGVTFPMAADPEFKAIDAYQLAGAPLNVLVDKEGVIRYRHTGYEPGDEAQYTEAIDKLLSR